MSTKIYNGYRLPVMSMPEFHAFSKRFLQEAEKTVVTMFEQVLVNCMVDMMDDVRVWREDLFISTYLGEVQKKMKEPPQTIGGFKFINPMRVAYQEILHRYHEIQRTSYRDPVVDFDCKVVFISVPDKKNELQLVALLYTEQSELHKLWKAQPEVSYFGYWNGEDADKNASEEEWQERKELWDTVFPDDKRVTPNEAGFTVEYTKGIPSLIDTNLQRLATMVPPLEQRALRVAEQLLMDEKYVKLKEEGVEDGDRYRLASRWMRSEEGQTAKTQRAKELESKLIQDIQPMDFRKDFAVLRDM